MSQVLCLHGYLANAARVNTPFLAERLLAEDNVLYYSERKNV